MSKVPPLRAAKKPNIFGAIDKKESEFSTEKIGENSPDLTQPELGFLNNSLVTALVTDKESISNPLVTALVTDKESISNRGDVFENADNSNKELISNRISNRKNTPISNPLVTALVTAKRRETRRQIYPNMTYQQVKELVGALSGNQLKVVRLVAKLCHSRQLLSSGPIPTETLRTMINGNTDVVKSTTEKLRIKGFVDRDKINKGKRGNCGFVVLCTTAYVRDAALEIESISNPLVTALVTAKTPPLVTHKEPHKEPHASSSSSINLERERKTTTTREPELPDEWKTIDCAPLQAVGIEFGESHLLRLYESGKTNHVQVQENIKRVAFAVKNKTQIFKKNPVAMLMGLLPKGKDFDVPQGYYNSVAQKVIEPVNGDERSTPEDKALAYESQAKLHIAGLLKSMPKS
jgi:hypothetical protein